MTNKKTAVSLDESVFEKADSLAREMGVSRSKLYETALKAYIEDNENRMLLAELNEAYKDGPTQEELERLEEMKAYQRRLVEGEW